MNNSLIVAITGACGRLGSAFARSIVGSGGKVLLGDVDSDLGAKLVEELGSSNACFCRLDVRSIESIREFITSGNSFFGVISSAVHCAYPRSSSWGTPFGSLTEESLGEDLFAQLGGTILFSQEIIENFKKQGQGNLVLVSSIQGISAPKFHHYEGTKIISPIEYSAIKAGVISVTKYLAKYLKGQSIRVNCISPGGILDSQDETFITNYNKDCITKGLLDAEDVCGAMMFLLSKDSSFITGQNIVVDDGWSL